MNSPVFVYKDVIIRNIKRTYFILLTFFLLHNLSGYAQSFVQEEWVDIFSGPDELRDGAFAIGVDKCIYVSGISEVASNSFKITTLKYSPAGTLLWSRQYLSPGKFDEADQVYDLKVDDNGAVYIAAGVAIGDAGGDKQFTVLSYKSTGLLRYVAIHADTGEARALTLDPSGNLYVTGWTKTSPDKEDFTTVKYNSSGVQQWSTKYNSGGRDIALSIGLDNFNNAYVTGVAYNTLSGKADHHTIKYNDGGAQQWLETYTNGPSVIFSELDNSLEASHLAIDANNNVYVTGIFDNGMNSDYAITKYDISGTQLWTEKFNAGNLLDVVTALAVNPAGEVFVTGRSILLGTQGEDFSTVKYSTNGSLQWEARYNGSATTTDQPAAIALDGDNNVYVTGGSTRLGTSLDFATIKYNSSGVQQWEQFYEGPPPTDFDLPSGIALDSDGNVYVTGLSFNVSLPLADFVTIKYSQGIPKAKLRSFDCGRSNVSITDTLCADSVLGATAYEFIITHQLSSFSFTYVSSVAKLPIAQVIGLEAAKIYEVQVRPIFGLNPGQFGRTCIFSISRDDITWEQAPMEFIGEDLYSDFITFQTINNTIIDIPTGDNIVRGSSKITSAPARNIFEEISADAGINPEEILFTKSGIYEALPYENMKNIYYAKFPGKINIDNLLASLESTVSIIQAQPPSMALLEGGITYSDNGDPANPNNKWDIEKIQAPNSWIFLQGLGKTTVGIIEPLGRADFTHPELSGNIANYSGTPPSDYDNYPDGNGDPSVSPHATLVGSLIASTPNSNTNYSCFGAPGNRGTVPISFNTTDLASHMFPWGGNGLIDGVTEFLNADVQSGNTPRLLSLSFVYVDADPLNPGRLKFKKDKSTILIEMDLLQNIMFQEGITVFAGTGNNIECTFLSPPHTLLGIGYPFSEHGVIGVGATRLTTGIEHGLGGGPNDYACTPLSYPNSVGNGWNYNIVDNDPMLTFPADGSGGYLDLTAPGFNVNVALTTGGINSCKDVTRAGGTSLSSPLVAAIAGAMLSLNPNLSRTDVERILFGTADKVLYHPFGLTRNQLSSGTTSFVTGYRYDNDGDFSVPDLDWIMGKGRVNMLSAIMNTAGLKTGGFTITNTAPFTEHHVTIANVNDHKYLYALPQGSYNESYEYDAVLNENGAVVNFNGTGVILELAQNSTFRISGGAKLSIENDAELRIQSGTGVAPGDVTRLVVEQDGELKLEGNNLSFPDFSFLQVQSGGTLIIQDNSELVIQSGATLHIKAGATLNIPGNGLITIEDGGYICIEIGAIINLDVNGTRIDLLATSIVDINPITAVSSLLCQCPYDIGINGPGDINVFFAALVASITVDQNSGVVCNGQLSVSSTGGFSPFDYLWDDPLVQITPTATGLCSGTYNVTVTDAYGCTSVSTSSITGPVTTLFVSFTSSNVSCFGLTDGQATASITGGSGNYSYTWSTIPVQNTQTAAGLTAGVYFISVIDNNTSDVIAASVTITEPPPLALATSTTDACFGINDGTTTVAIGGGTPGYGILWNDPGGQATPTAFGLFAGGYNVTVTDANSCVVLVNVTVNQPANPFNVTVTTSDVSCNGGNDGQASLSVSGSTSPYQYLWDDVNTQSTATAMNLFAGTYSVTITDVNGCTTVASAVITEPGNSPLVIQMTSSDVSCNGGSNGSASANVSGGTGPYIYNWSPSAQLASTATGLSAGLYTVTVLDALGNCESASIQVNEPDIIAITFVVTDITCNGTEDGSITITNISGGISPYALTWLTAPAFGQGLTQSNLPSGLFSVFVKDAAGCSKWFVFNVNEPFTDLSTSFSTTGNSVCGASDGTATVVVSGGTSPYVYVWDDPGTQSNAAATGLAPGDYSVSITDINGECLMVENIIVDEAINISLIFTYTTISCAGGNDGTITVTPSGGTDPYNYEWDSSPQQFTQTIVGLTSGVYNVTVTDDNGCAAFGIWGVLGPSLPLSVTISQIDNLCNGDNNGSIDLQVVSGNSPFTYNWSTGATSQDISGLAVGTYTVTVTNAQIFGCTEIVSVTITEPPLLVVNSTTTLVPCNGGTAGTATAIPSGGTAPFAYLWDSSTGNQTTETATGLSSGTYSVTVTDANNCTFTNPGIIVQDPPILTLDLSGSIINCSGTATGIASANGGLPPYSILWSDGQTGSGVFLSPGTYTATVTDDLGCVVGSASITVPVAFTLNGSSGVNVDCFNDGDGVASVTVSGGSTLYTYAWSNGVTVNTGGTTNTLTGLSGGIYDVTVTDDAGCSVTSSVTVTEPSASMAVTWTASDISCFGDGDGSITLNITGGTTPYSAFWSGPGTFTSTDLSLTNLETGNYLFTLSDANGCPSIFGPSIFVDEPGPFTAVASITSSYNFADISCDGGSDGSASVLLNGGVAPFNVTWFPGFLNGTSISGLSAGTYTAFATDANTCFATSSVTLTDPGPISLSFVVQGDCAGGGNEGAIDLTSSGGTFPYGTQWTGPGGTFNTEDISNIPDGTYNVTVTDANGCTESTSVVVPIGTVIPTPNLGVPRTVCSVTKVGLDAGPGVSYAWTLNGNSIGGNTQFLSPTVNGIYCVTVTNSDGCDGTNCVDLDVDDPIKSINILVPLGGICVNTQVCFVGSVGLIQPGGGFGNNNPIYTWSFPTASSTTINGNKACAIFSTFGSHTFTFSITNECGTFTKQKTIIVAPFNPPVVTTSTTFASCELALDGTATANVTGGVGPFKYQWDDLLDQVTQTAIELTGKVVNGDVYNVTVTGANGCKGTASATIFAFIKNCGPAGGCRAQVVVQPWGFDPSCPNTLITSPCPQKDYGYNMTFTSTNFVPAGSIVVKLDPTMTYLSTVWQSVDLGAPIVSGGGRIITWPIIGGGTYFGVEITTHVFGTPSDDTWVTQATIQRDCFGDFLVTGTYLEETTPMCSCDPNDKMLVSPNGCGDIGFIANEPLLYTIRFQNIGTGPAANVKILDTLDVNLDLSSLNVLASTHTITSNSIILPNILEIKFDGINLPPVITDQIGSNGFVIYQITPNQPLPNGTPIENSAAIFFDSNPPVITNNVMNTIVDDPSVTVDAGPDQILCIGTDTLACVNLSASASGVLPPYSFLWSSGETTQDISQCIEETTVFSVVADVEGCFSEDAVTVIVSSEFPPSISNTIGEVSCSGGNDGSIDITVSGGTPPYVYSWSTSATTEDISGLSAGIFSVLVTDDNGCTTSDTITINDGPSLVIDSGLCATVYLGYPPAECAILAPTVSGGSSPFTYLWSTGATTATITVCPTATSSFNVSITDANGCAASNTVTVNVVDVRCGKNLNKVRICHVPSGNPLNVQELCVAQGAVAAHLANHGDQLGSCIFVDPCLGSAKMAQGGSHGDQVNEEVPGLDEHASESSLDKVTKVFPNPNAGEFTLIIVGKEIRFKPSSIYLYDALGQLVFEEKNINRYAIYFDISEQPKGVYFLKVTQGNSVFTDKIIYH